MFRNDKTYQTDDNADTDMVVLSSAAAVRDILELSKLSMSLRIRRTQVY